MTAPAARMAGRLNAFRSKLMGPPCCLLHVSAASTACAFAGFVFIRQSSKTSSVEMRARRRKHDGPGRICMDFELPEDIRLLRDTVRKFVDRELIPIEMHSMDGPDLKPET